MTDKYQLLQDIPAEIFRAYDIRGIVTENLTPDIVYTIGRALAELFLEHKQPVVVVGRDGRLSSPSLVAALQAGLGAGGIDVIDIGLVPTPLVYFAVHHLNTTSGVMLTGSHNPSDYNGLKIVLQGNSLTELQLKTLYQRILAGNFPTHEAHQIQKEEIIASYIERIVSDVKLARPLKVVIDAGNGAASELAPELFGALGCEVIPLFCKFDGHFPNHHPDPSIPENLTALINEVKRVKADIGLAFDGDADRLGVVTNTGEIIWPDRQMMLFAQDILSRKPGGEIIFDVKCTKHLAPLILAAGGKPFLWKTGHSLIKAKLKERQAVFAGEMSGHLFFSERWYGFDDGLYSGARLLEILAKQSLDATSLFAKLPNSINTPELKIPMHEQEKFGFMQKLQETAQFPGAEIVTVDGLRVEYPYGFGLVRPSNTSPCLTVRFEADNARQLQTIKEQFRTQLCHIKSDLQLPF